MTLTRSEREPVDAERVTRSVELDAAPAEVWDALTEGALLGEWLADEVELEAEPGGEIVCRYADGEERRGEVELVEEAERLAWSWRREGGAPSRVELVLDAVAERTRLTIIETAPLHANGPLLLAGIADSRGRAWSGPMLAAAAGPIPASPSPLSPCWGPPLGRLRDAVRLVLA
ncbi:MAG TPA: SRPBCC domain-containing protein [Solirubrobacterales bacterium]|nr:SRPBCC domain-containing protein [Solirubrobacterales bacterium]